jgi:hypothetical protein
MICEGFSQACSSFSSSPNGARTGLSTRIHLSRTGRRSPPLNANTKIPAARLSFAATRGARTTPQIFGTMRRRIMPFLTIYRNSTGLTDSKKIRIRSLRRSTACSGLQARLSTLQNFHNRTLIGAVPMSRTWHNGLSFTQILRVMTNLGHRGRENSEAR